MHFLKRTHILGGLIGVVVGIFVLPRFVISLLSGDGNLGEWGHIVGVLLISAIPTPFGLPPILTDAILSFALGWTLAFVHARYKQPSKEKRIVTVAVAISTIGFCTYVGQHVIGFLSQGSVCATSTNC